MDNSSSSKTIAKNTIYLYIRMLLTMVVSLYTSRIVLKTLGVDDFGIYNVVGGLVSLSSLLGGTMYVTISRFLTYELGRGDLNRLKKVFSTSVNIQIFLSLIIIIIAETIGLWFLHEKMLIPDGRMFAANWVYQCSLLSFVIGLVSTPYNAVVIAHEKMSWYAYFSIIEVILKLIIVLCLVLSPWDKLIAYSTFLVVVSILMRWLYAYYCRRYFEESRYTFVYDKSLLVEMGAFAGWNNLGAMAVILRTQGVNVLMNLFFGVTVNAARAIAVQVESAVNQFVNSFSVALNPQITKSFAKEDSQLTNSLIYQGAKYTFYLMLFAAIPITFEAPMILKLWLGGYPEFTVLFLRLTIFVALVDKLSDTLTMSLQASGNIKGLHIMVGCLVIPVIPISYYLYRVGMPAYVSYLIIAIALLSKFLSELLLARNIVGISIIDYCKHVILKIVLVSIFASLIPSIIVTLMNESIFRLILLTFVSLAWTAMVVYAVGVSNHERRYIVAKMNSLIKQKIKK